MAVTLFLTFPGVLAHMARYELSPTPDNVTDVFSRDRPAVLTVSPGDTVAVRSYDASGYLARQQHPGDRQPTMFSEARGHCLTGPIAVRGARPGMVLSVRFESLRPDDWGWTVAAASDDRLKRRLGVADGPSSWLLWDLDADQGTGTNDLGHTVTLAPFLGVVGMPPDEPGEHSTKPPRAQGGGNIDCRELVAGATLYLPVTVPDALLYMGDGHAAQGDGEVGGTAIECSMTTEAVLDLITDPAGAGDPRRDPGRPDHLRLQPGPQRGHGRRTGGDDHLDAVALRPEQGRGSGRGQPDRGSADHPGG